MDLMREEVRGAMHRHHARKRKLAARYILRPNGMPRKTAKSEEAMRNNEAVRFRMNVELLRNFLSEAEQIVAEYVHFYNFERISRKNGLTPVEIWSKAA